MAPMGLLAAIRAKTVIPAPPHNTLTPLQRSLFVPCARRLPVPTTKTTKTTTTVSSLLPPSSPLSSQWWRAPPPALPRARRLPVPTTATPTAAAVSCLAGDRDRVPAAPRASPAPARPLVLWGEPQPIPPARQLRALEEQHRGALRRMPVVPLATALAMGKSHGHLQRQQTHLAALARAGVTYDTPPATLALAIVTYVKEAVDSQRWERSTAASELERCQKAVYRSGYPKPLYDQVRADPRLQDYKASMDRFAPRRVPRTLPPAQAVDLGPAIRSQSAHPEVRRALCLLVSGAHSRPAVALRVGDVRLVRAHHVVSAPLSCRTRSPARVLLGGAASTRGSSPGARSLLVRCAHLKTARTLADVRVDAELAAVSGLASWIAGAVPDDLCCALAPGPTAELQRLLAAQGLSGHDLKRVVLQALRQPAEKQRAGLHRDAHTTARYTWMVEDPDSDESDGSGGLPPSLRRHRSASRAPRPRRSRAGRSRAPRARPDPGTCSTSSSLADSCPEEWVRRRARASSGAEGAVPPDRRSRTAPFPRPSTTPLPSSLKGPRLRPVPAPSDIPPQELPGSPGPKRVRARSE